MGNQTQPLGNLEKHHTGWFPATLLNRRETIEETLNRFEADDRFELNRLVAVRTHELYEPGPESLEQLRQALVRNTDFVHVEILQEPSDLGIASKILARDRTGQVILYDGVIWRVTEPVYESDFALEQIYELADWPGNPSDIVDSLQHSLREVIEGLREGLTFYSFYTVSIVDWKALGLRREGDVGLRLGYEGWRRYSVYIGDRDTTLQMIASDLHIGMELRRFQRYFDEQRAILEKLRETTTAELDGLLESLLRFGRKHKQWNSVKGSLKTLNQVYSILGKGMLLLDSLSEVIEERLAFYYPGRAQRPCPGFFVAEVKGGRLQDLSEKPEEPIYTHRFQSLQRKIDVLREEVVTALNTEKDLLTAFQTEFSLYAVWLAVIALIASLVSIVVAVLGDCWNAG